MSSCLFFLSPHLNSLTCTIPYIAALSRRDFVLIQYSCPRSHANAVLFYFTHDLYHLIDEFLFYSCLFLILILRIEWCFIKAVCALNSFQDISESVREQDSPGKGRYVHLQLNDYYKDDWVLLLWNIRCTNLHHLDTLWW